MLLTYSLNSSVVTPGAQNAAVLVRTAHCADKGSCIDHEYLLTPSSDSSLLQICHRGPSSGRSAHRDAVNGAAPMTRMAAAPLLALLLVAAACGGTGASLLGGSKSPEAAMIAWLKANGGEVGAAESRRIAGAVAAPHTPRSAAAGGCLPAGGALQLRP